MLLKYETLLKLVFSLVCSILIYSFSSNSLQNIALKIYNQSSPCYSNYDITIKKELRTIFEGTEDEDVVTTKGRDVFESHIKCGHEKCV